MYTINREKERDEFYSIYTLVRFSRLIKPYLSTSDILFLLLLKLESSLYLYPLAQPRGWMNGLFELETHTHTHAHIYTLSRSKYQLAVFLSRKSWIIKKKKNNNHNQSLLRLAETSGARRESARNKRNPLTFSPQQPEIDKTKRRKRVVYIAVRGGWRLQDLPTKMLTKIRIDVDEARSLTTCVCIDVCSLCIYNIQLHVPFSWINRDTAIFNAAAAAAVSASRDPIFNISKKTLDTSRIRESGVCILRAFYRY